MGARYCIVGAGFSGAVVARALAEANLPVLVVDERPTTAGNCYTERDAETGVMKHVYGPHIFHTSKQHVWDYVVRFGVMMPYAHRVMARVEDRVFSLPVNLLTLNQFFGMAMSPGEARSYVAAKTMSNGAEPANFEEQALAMVGPQLYHAFFRGYTRKQWGVEPTALPASILKRLPLRFDYDDRYFDHIHQAIPREGYTRIIEAILDHPGIDLQLKCRFEDLDERFGHVVYSGCLDRYFNYEHGRLAYRTLDFKASKKCGDYQGIAVMNYCDEAVPYTRVTEHKHFAPWERAAANGSYVYHEFSRSCGRDDIPYYPIRLAREQKMLGDYVKKATQLKGVTFVGRLGTYRYLDMDVTIEEALLTAETMIDCLQHGRPIPSFVVDPR